VSGFHEVNFPDDIAYGSAGGPGFKTQIVELPSGSEERVQVFEGGRMEFDVSYGVRKPEQLAAVQRFYRLRRGAFNGFRFKDFYDFNSNTTNPSYEGAGQGTRDQVIGVGDDSNTVFQLKKVYSDGTNSTDRLIFKPVEGTVRVWVNGVEQTTGWSLNTTNGNITFDTAPAAGHTIEASFDFDVPVRFGASADQLLTISVDNFGTGSIPSIPLIELLDPSGGYESENFAGGSVDRTITGSLSVTTGVAFTWRINATNPGLNVNLPAASTVEDGRPQFMIINDGSNSFNVRDGENVPSTILTLSAGEAALLSAVKAPTEKVWFAV